MASEESLSGARVPSARMHPGLFSRAISGLVGPAMSRIFDYRVRALIDKRDDPAVSRRVGLVQAAGYVFDERREKDLAAVLGIVFLREHPADMHDFGAGDPQAGVELGKLGKHIAGKGIFQRVRFNKHERLLKILAHHKIVLSKF